MAELKLVRSLMTNTKKPTFRNGVMHKLVVYDNGAIVGYGFVIMYPDGKVSAPELFELFAGNSLPVQRYQLQMTNDHFNVVVPRNVQ